MDAYVNPIHFSYFVSVGVNWYELRTTLNDKFDWHEAVSNVLGGKSLEVVRYIYAKRVLLT
jgi:hypothetical protein